MISREKKLFKQLRAKPSVGTETPQRKSHKEIPSLVGDESHSVIAHPKGKGFSDVAGMDTLKQMFTDNLINVIRNKRNAEVYHISPPATLLYGPSGTGKTYLAMKVAEEAGINFMKVVPDDVASSYIHGTQQKVGELFREAENKAPVIMFIDEIDAMMPSRNVRENAYVKDEVNEWLTVLNEASHRGIYIIAASNHPEMIDKAILRSGRIDQLIYVGMPDVKGRESMFRLALSRLPASKDIDFGKLAKMTDGFTFADIQLIVDTAARKMFNTSVKQTPGQYPPVTEAVMEKVISSQSPSVSKRDLKEYERIHSEFSPKDEGVRQQSIGFI